MPTTTLTQKLEGLKAQLAQLQANSNAVAGAIQFCESLIKEEVELINAPLPETTDTSDPSVKE
jgi:hypothetical protein